MTENELRNQILVGDCLDRLKDIPDKSIDCCITSPPYYGLRDYGTGIWVGGDPNCPHRRVSKQSDKTITGHAQEELKGNVGDAIYKTVCPLCGAVREDKQIGLEETPEAYIEKLVSVFREVKRVLKDEGTLWVNIGDSYWGSGSRGWDFTGKLTEKSAVQAGSKGTVNLSNIPKLVGSYNDIKNKDMVGIPWMLAFALRADGWYLRQDIIWHKPNPMPESVKDRCTKSHEYMFLLSKNPQYYFDYESIQEEAKYKDDPRSGEGRIAYEGKRTEGNDIKAQQSFVSITDKRNKRDVWEVEEDKTPATKIRFGGNKYGDNDDPHFQTKSGKEWTPHYKNLEYKGQTPQTMHERRAEGFEDEQYIVRNKRDVWTVPPSNLKEAHFATFPEKLIEPCILAGCPKGGIVLDPFFGSGTTGRVALSLGRDYVGIELNPDYVEMAEKRTDEIQLTLFC